MRATPPDSWLDQHEAPHKMCVCIYMYTCVYMDMYITDMSIQLHMYIYREIESYNSVYVYVSLLSRSEK